MRAERQDAERAIWVGSIRDRDDFKGETADHAMTVAIAAIVAGATLHATDLGDRTCWVWRGSLLHCGGVDVLSGTGRTEC